MGAVRQPKEKFSKLRTVIAEAKKEIAKAMVWGSVSRGSLRWGRPASNFCLILPPLESG